MSELVQCLRDCDEGFTEDVFQHMEHLVLIFVLAKEMRVCTVAVCRDIKLRGHGDISTQASYCMAYGAMV